MLRWWFGLSFQTRHNISGHYHETLCNPREISLCWSQFLRFLFLLDGCGGFCCLCCGCGGHGFCCFTQSVSSRQRLSLAISALSSCDLKIQREIYSDSGVFNKNSFQTWNSIDSKLHNNSLAHQLLNFGVKYLFSVTSSRDFFYTVQSSAAEKCRLTISDIR